MIYHLRRPLRLSAGCSGALWTSMERSPSLLEAQGDIGGAISKALAASGANVVVSYAGDAGRADATIDAVRQLGGQGLAVQLDQRDPKSINSCVDKVIGGFGRIDILVNNAAWNIGIPFPALDALTADIWDRVHETNVRGPFLLSRAFASGASASQDGPYRQHCVALPDG